MNCIDELTSQQAQIPLFLKEVPNICFHSNALIVEKMEGSNTVEPPALYPTMPHEISIDGCVYALLNQMFRTFTYRLIHNSTPFKVILFKRDIDSNCSLLNNKRRKNKQQNNIH